jgi:hypothetical protein
LLCSSQNKTAKVRFRSLHLFRLVGVEDRLRALGVGGGRLDTGALDLQELADRSSGSALALISMLKTQAARHPSRRAKPRGWVEDLLVVRGAILGNVVL